MLLMALIQALSAQGVDPGQAIQMMMAGQGGGPGGPGGPPPMPGGGPPGPAGGPGRGAGQMPGGGPPVNLMG